MIYSLMRLSSDCEWYLCSRIHFVVFTKQNKTNSSHLLHILQVIELTFSVLGVAVLLINLYNSTDAFHQWQYFQGKNDVPVLTKFKIYRTSTKQLIFPYGWIYSHFNPCWSILQFTFASMLQVHTSLFMWCILRIGFCGYWWWLFLTYS